MGRDVKIGLALGLVVIVVAIVIFSVAGGGRRQTDTPTAAQPPAPAPGPAPGPTTRPGQRPEGDLVIDTGAGRGAPTGGPPGGDIRTDSGGTPHAAAPSGGGGALATGAREHVVVAGDNLWSLALKYYGSGAAAAKIHEANKDKLPRQDSPLRIGMRLALPDVPAARDTAGHAGASGSISLGTGTGSASATAGEDEYTVQTGDTLASIARHFYGSERMVKPIVTANPRLAQNPNRIGVGWKLRIPRIAGTPGSSTGTGAGAAVARARDID